MGNNMAKRIEAFEYNGITFYFSYDFDIKTQTYIPHIIARRGLSIEDALYTYFNITNQVFNINNNRWEAYSNVTNLGLYYNHYKCLQDNILIISLFFADNDLFKKLKINYKETDR